MSGILRGLMEKRFHVSQEPPGWVSKYFGNETYAGVNVTEETALTFTAVYACIRILSETLASLPLITYRRLKGGGKERAPDFYLYPILHDMANPEMTSYQLRETMMGHVVTWGNGYAQIVFDQGGRVRELWPLRPDKMRVERVNGVLEYTYRLDKPDKNGNLERKFPAWQILHVPGLGFDGIQGYSPIAMAREAIALGMAAEEFGGRFYSNNANLGVVFEHPNALSDPAYKRLHKDLVEDHVGVTKSHKPFILEEGMKASKLGIPQDEAQFLETRKFQILEVCRIYNVPPHMLAELERATWANIEDQSLNFVIYTMRSWLVRWEQCYMKSLLSASDRETYFVEHLVDGLLRGNLKARYDAYHIARLDGWMNVDEIRELENMNPLPKGQGQVYLIPLNMVPASTKTGEGREMVIAKAAKAMRGLYRDTLERIYRREKNDVLSAAKKFLEKRNFDKFTSWMDEFYAEHRNFITRQMKPLLESHSAAILGEKDGFSANIDHYLAGFGEKLVENSRSEVEKIVIKAQDQTDFESYGALEGLLEGQLEEIAEILADQESVHFGGFILRTAHNEKQESGGKDA